MENKYKTLSEFKKDYPNECQSLHKKKLLEKLCNDMGWKHKVKKSRGYWTKERCMEDAIKFSTKELWKINNASAHGAAKKNKWLDECCSHMEKKIYKPRGYWSKERCIEESLKYKTKKEWRDNNISSLTCAIKKGWEDECCSHMEEDLIKPAGYWSKERCLEEALKYKTRNEWKNNCVAALCAAKKKGWYVECTKHMPKYAK